MELPLKHLRKRENMPFILIESVQETANRLADSMSYGVYTHPAPLSQPGCLR